MKICATLKPLSTEADYQEALKLLGAFFDNNPDNAPQEEADYFEVLADLVGIYETAHYPIDPPEPIEAIKFRMERMGLEIGDELQAEIHGQTIVIKAAKRPKYKLSDLLAEMPEGAHRVEGWDEMPDVGREMAK
ncbi:hypothetical protein [Neisseria weixii]|uniref:hypothetical protein n=1 Tax=Neisseria weixii TaxID=1853276 RepID=UPI00359FC6BC